MQNSKMLAAVAFLSLLIGSPHGLQAQTNFYQGKTITIIVGTVPGGLYDRWGRLFGRIMGKYIPGNPTFVVQSMPGGGGLRATNFLFNQAPKDGSMLGMIHATAILAPLYGTKAAMYDSREFNWLGAMNTATAVCVAWPVMRVPMAAMVAS